MSFRWTLERKLGARYALVAGVCLLLLAGLAHHEFVVEPRERAELGVPEPPETAWAAYAETFFYGMIPVVLGLGWWTLRRTLKPIDDLTRRVERIHAGNLREPLPRLDSDDEVARLTDVFNGLARRLDDSFQKIREFTLHASHELKTPLTVMRAEVETRLRGELPAAERERAQTQLDEVERLARIVDSLTLLTKADAGLVTVERRPVPLGELVRECHEDAIVLGEPHGVTARLEECEDVVVEGDRDRLRQLLLNLAANAVTYNEPGGFVSFRLRCVDGRAALTVANTGPGIPPELAGRVFERFLRGSESRSRAPEGCGLGLTICRWIVESHGGAISIATGADGLTRAVVELPAGR